MKRKGEDEVDEKEEDGRMSPQRNVCARYVHHRTSKSRQTPSVSVCTQQSLKYHVILKK